MARLIIEISTTNHRYFRSIDQHDPFTPTQRPRSFAHASTTSRTRTAIDRLHRVYTAGRDPDRARRNGKRTGGHGSVLCSRLFKHRPDVCHLDWPAVGAMALCRPDLYCGSFDVIGVDCIPERRLHRVAAGLCCRRFADGILPGHRFIFAVSTGEQGKAMHTNKNP